MGGQNIRGTIYGKKTVLRFRGFDVVSRCRHFFLLCKVGGLDKMFTEFCETFGDFCALL